LSRSGSAAGSSSDRTTRLADSTRFRTRRRSYSGGRSTCTPSRRPRHLPRCPPWLRPHRRCRRFPWRRRYQRFPWRRRYQRGRWRRRYRRFPWRRHCPRRPCGRRCPRGPWCPRCRYKHQRGRAGSSTTVRGEGSSWPLSLQQHPDQPKHRLTEPARCPASKN
jgi:hypothetical protein